MKESPCVVSDELAPIRTDLLLVKWMLGLLLAGVGALVVGAFLP